MILGCTHYPLIRGMLQRELGPRRRARLGRRGARRGGRGDARAQAHRPRARAPRLLPLRLHGRRRGLRDRRPPLPAAADLERARARRGRARRARTRDLGATPSELAGRHVRPDAPRLRRCDTTAAQRTSCALSTSCRGSSRRRTARCCSRSARTRVICTASIDSDTPRWLRGTRARLGQRRVRDAARPRRAAQAARLLARPARRPLDRDPAPDRALAARDRRPEGARRAHGLGRLRRAAGRRRHPLRLDLRRLRRAAPRAQRPGRRGRDLRAAADRGRRRRLLRHRRRARRCSTSTTRRTRPPRSTSTSS